MPALLFAVMTAAFTAYCSLSFHCGRLCLQVEVADVVNAESEQPVKYAIRTGMQTESYEVL